jgi:hypothetical protein
MHRIAAGFACLLLIACIPLHVTTQSRVAGQVVDAKTATPVAAAELHCAQYPGKKVRTDASGGFELQKVEEWHWVQLGGDYLSDNCTLVAEAPKYRGTTQRVRFGDDTSQTVRLEANP